MSQEALLIADICEIADRPIVEAIENRFAGYFNELGIVVKLRADAGDADVIALQNQLLEYFTLTSDDRPPEFTWVIKFFRDGKELRSLFPGDDPRKAGDDLEWKE